VLTYWAMRNSLNANENRLTQSRLPALAVAT
jgi:hypothetical protein